MVNYDDIIKSADIKLQHIKSLDATAKSRKLSNGITYAEQQLGYLAFSIIISLNSNRSESTRARVIAELEDALKIWEDDQPDLISLCEAMSSGRGD